MEPFASIVVAESFGEIFVNNCVRQGLLPAQLTRDRIAAPAAIIARGESSAVLTVDLPARTIVADGAAPFAFAISDGPRHRLLNGLDEIEETLRLESAIERWEAADRVERPWIHLPLRPAVA